MFDLDHPFFKPLPIRLAVVAVCFGWAVFETFWGSDLFAFLFFGLSVYAAYRFFITFDRDGAEAQDPDHPQ